LIEARNIVVGAGAAGLWAAWRLAQQGTEVVLLEKMQQTGTKVLASGGSRCNLTTALDGEQARHAFGKDGARFLRHAFRIMPPQGVRERFAELGVPTEEAPFEKVFPTSGRAVDVRNALERAVRQAGARILCHAAVLEIRRESNAWLLALAGGRKARCRTLLLASGGKSYARTGTTGDGYRWLGALGLPLVPPRPALVPLLSRAPWVSDLAGVTLEHVEIKLCDERGRVLGRRRRPLLFTHTGVSGPGAMDLSEIVSRSIERDGLERQGEPPLELAVDLLPGQSEDSVRILLEQQEGCRATKVLQTLPLRIPRRVFDQVLRQADLIGEGKATILSGKKARSRMLLALKGLRIPVHGTRGFDHAEVTAGGLDLAAVDGGSMRVKGVDDLFVIGELLDLHGPIGGFNFQSAFATAEVAARATPT